MSTLNKSINQPDKAEVLTKALLNVRAYFDLKGKDLNEILGISESSASRLLQKKMMLSPETKEGELSLLLIRIYRSLITLVGEDEAKTKAWLTSYNHYFDNTPLEHMKRIDGLVDVVQYLDTMRGKL